MAQVLIVEDDPDIASLLTRALQGAGHGATWVSTSETALAALHATRHDALIVDMMLGEDSGADLLRELRAKGHSQPALILSALSRVEERAAGLSAGAQDYVAKPFQISELLTRLEVQLHRHPNLNTPQRFEHLLWDPENREMRALEPAPCAPTAPLPRPVTLTEREAELMSYLLGHIGQLRTRGQIFDALWAKHGSSTDNVVDVYIGYLRRKLKAFAPYGLTLHTLRGKGFSLHTRLPAITGETD